MILLAFLFPVAIYLLVLGRVNRRRTPLRVSGVWDFIGLLGALSGFLLLGGPAVLSSLSTGWRNFWVTGQVPAEEGWPLWVFLAGAYFLVVVVGAGFVFWYQRHLTAIYNVDPPALERALEEVCDRLGLRPVRSGNLFLFGMPLRSLAPRPAPGAEGIQAPHYRPPRRPPSEKFAEEASVVPRTDAPAGDLAGETAVLEVHSFAAMWHATLRWDPAQSNLRRAIEAELDRTLAEMPVPEHDLGPWLTLVGLALLCATLLGLILLMLFSSR